MRRRHRVLRALAGALAVLSSVVAVGAAVNDHFAYLPSLASLWGWRAADQTTWSTVHRRVLLRAAVSGVLGVPAHGAVVKVHIPGRRSGFRARPAEVYLPPAWFLSPRPQLPVIEMLHGTPGTPEDWTRSSGADLVSDAWAATHQGMSPILVMPDINGSFTGDSECTDGTAGHVDTYLSVDVPVWVATHLDPARTRNQWAIGGLSEGGTCAVNLALRHVDRWSTFLDLGGDDHISRSGGELSLFTGTIRKRRERIASYDPMRLIHRFRDPSLLQGWFEVGASDGSSARAVRRVAAAAHIRGMTVHLAVRPGGGHNWHVWRAGFRDALPWLAMRLGAANIATTHWPGPGTRLVDLRSSDRSFSASRPAADR